MFYGNQVQDTRQMFYTSWQKYRQNQHRIPIEQQIVNVIIDHPEYHGLLEKPDASMDETYFPELGQTNPFLHMGLHLAVRDQITLNQPSGIQDLYQRLLMQHQNHLLVEHLMMESLAECLWLAQRQQTMPDEQQYLQTLKKRL